MVFFKFLMKLGREDSGATAIEYGLILALIAIGMLGALQSLGGETAYMLSGVNDKMIAAKIAAKKPTAD